MPSSVKTRPTTDHEYIFFFSNSRKKYFYDADAVREPHVTFSKDSKMKGGRGHFGKRGGTPEKGKNGGDNNLHDGRLDQAFHPKGRNKRTVWSISLSKFRDAHFAVFPESLVQPASAKLPREWCGARSIFRCRDDRLRGSKLRANIHRHRLRRGIQRDRQTAPRQFIDRRRKDRDWVPADPMAMMN